MALATQVMADPQRMLDEQVQEELGIAEPHMSPLREGWVTGLATAFGAVIPVFPFFVLAGTPAIVAVVRPVDGVALPRGRRRGRCSPGVDCSARDSTCSSSVSASPWWATSSAAGWAGCSRRRPPRELRG